MKNIKRLIFSALLLLALSSPLAAYDYRDFENHIYYQAYMAGKGWLPVVGQSEVAGTPGESRAMCAVRIYSDVFSTIDEGIYYRVHLTRTVTRRRFFGLWTEKVVDWSGWSEWAFSWSGGIAGITKSDGSVDEAFAIGSIEIKVQNPVPEYVIAEASYDQYEGWESDDNACSPSNHSGYLRLIPNLFNDNLECFILNVWGQGPGWYMTL